MSVTTIKENTMSDVELPILKTPYTKLNDALGSLNGFRRGELVLITSVAHGYRNELALDLYLGTALVNKPDMIDDSKIPLILDIVFDTHTFMYKSVLMSRYRQIINEPEVTDFQLLEKYGYQYRSLVVPHSRNFKLRELFSLANEIIAAGYELHQICVGDLSQIDRTDLEGKSISLTEMYNQLRQFFGKLGCTVITTLSLDEMERMRKLEESKSMATYLEAQQDMDIDKIIQHVDTAITVDFNGESLSIVCDKHRGSILTESTQDMPIAAEGYFKADEPWVTDDK